MHDCINYSTDMRDITMQAHGHKCGGCKKKYVCGILSCRIKEGEKCAKCLLAEVGTVRVREILVYKDK